MPDPKNHYVCGVCYRGIARVTDDDGNITGFIHPVPNEGDAEHEVEPVLQADAGLFDEVCDFCNAPDVAWIEYCSPHRTPLPTGAIYSDDGEWASCDGCHEAILKGDRSELLSRSLERFKRNARLSKKDIPRVANQLSKSHDIFWDRKLDAYASVVVRP